MVDAAARRAVQNTKAPGDEVAVMGPYLSNVTYTGTSDFGTQPCRE